jgi:hypothetical protein
MRCRARATSCLLCRLHDQRRHNPPAPSLHAARLVHRVIGSTVVCGWPDGCTPTASPCHGRTSTSRLGGISTVGACRCRMCLAKGRNGSRRSAAGEPCFRRTYGMTRPGLQWPGGSLMGICPRGNNKVVLLNIPFVHN